MSLRNVKVKQEPVKLQMTSMIDVVFLLLAFFVITFKTPEVEGDFNIKMPANVQSNQLPDPDAPTPVQVRLAAGDFGQLVDMEFGSQPLGTDMKRLRAAVFDYLQFDPNKPGAVPNGDELEIELDCDEQLKYRYVMEAITAVTGYINSENQVVKLVEKVKFAPPE